MTTLALCFFAGILAARWLLKPLAALSRAAVFVLSLAAAYWLTSLAVPEIAEINWRGFWSGARVGLVLAVGIGSFWFYLLGWRARVSTTEQDDIERARQKAAKDRKLA